jgi:phage tail-like protein
MSPPVRRPSRPTGFRLKIGGVEVAGLFKEATGFDSETEVTEQKKSDPAGHMVIVQVPGLRRQGPLTLARPVTRDKGLWEWWRMAGEPDPTHPPRKDCTIDLLDQAGAAVATFSLSAAWPKKYVAAELHAGSDSDVVMERITIAHEGFRRV